jgi:hypothetical protein
MSQKTDASAQNIDGDNSNDTNNSAADTIKKRGEELAIETRG